MVDNRVVMSVELLVEGMRGHARAPSRRCGPMALKMALGPALFSFYYTFPNAVGI